jgi:hypothetical protein
VDAPPSYVQSQTRKWILAESAGGR